MSMLMERLSQPEYTYVSVLERYDCAVEDTVGTFLLVTADDRVLIIAPYRHALLLVFPAKAYPADCFR